MPSQPVRWRGGPGGADGASASLRRPRDGDAAGPRVNGRALASRALRRQALDAWPVGARSRHRDRPLGPKALRPWALAAASLGPRARPQARRPLGPPAFRRPALSRAPLGRHQRGAYRRTALTIAPAPRHALDSDHAGPPGLVPPRRWDAIPAMTQLTQLEPAAVPGRRHGSFAGKGASHHPAGKVTQLGPSASPGRRYGSFAAKRAAHAVGKLTRLSLLGVSWGRYRVNAFSGKTPALAPGRRRRPMPWTRTTRDRVGFHLFGGGTPPRSREERDRDH
jgi:hypothetical protein